jgi:putative hydrolase of the HAD superfamily
VGYLDAWFEAYLEDYEANWAAFDDVEAVMEALAANGDLQLGVITNAGADIQRRKLAAMGIGERLPAFVASSAVGKAKPDPAIFEAACELVGLPPHRVAYVGDRIDVDAIGARDAGLLAVWLDRPGANIPLAFDGPPPRGISVIKRLDELPAVLGLAD